MNLDSYTSDLSGISFGELVLSHYRGKSILETLDALLGTTARLPEAARGDVEAWIDQVNPRGIRESFWQTDAAKVLEQLSTPARQRLVAQRIDPTPDDLFNMFEIIVLSFAYTAHRHKESRMFIQKAIGQGFLRRLLDF